MTKEITVSELAAILEPLTGFVLADLSEVHIAYGSISFTTVPHHVTNVRQAGVIPVVPDHELEQDDVDPYEFLGDVVEPDDN